MHAFSWINYLLRPLTQAIHSALLPEDHFPYKTNLKIVKFTSAKICLSNICIIIQSEPLLGVKKLSCHFRVLKSYRSWRYILMRSPSSTAWKSKWQSVSWHWHRQLRTMFICVSCTILFVLPIHCITTCSCLLWPQLVFTKQKMHLEYMQWLVAGWTNANRKPKIN